MLLLLIQLSGVFAEAQCDSQCQKLWFDQRFESIQLAPPEVQVDLLLRAAQVEPDRERKLYVLHQAESQIAQVPELCPITGIVGFTDSVPGEVNRATALGFNQMDYRMRVVSIYATLDFDHAVAMWSAYRPPSLQRERSLRGETIGFQPMYRTALELYDEFAKRGNQIAGSLFLMRVLESIQTHEALADFHEILASKMRDSRLSNGFLDLYKNRLAKIVPDALPHEVVWYKIVFFWKLLLENEASKDKSSLLASIGSFLAKTAEAPPYDFCHVVSTASEARSYCRYWPKEAGERWERSIARIDFSPEEQESLNNIKAVFDKAANGTRVNATEIQMTKYWVRPKSIVLLQRVIDLQRSYKDLQSAGAWEPKLGDLLEDLKHHSSEKPNEIERMLDFLEISRVYQGFIGLTNYDRSLVVSKENAAEIQKQLEARPPHFAKEQLVHSFIGHLESEEGQWVYRQRRVLWLGILRRLIQELQTSQRELIAIFRERTTVSSNEVIRLYGADIER
jgi:hypothetical protein